MKYKVIGAFICIIAIFVSVFAPSFEEKANNRFVQHTDSHVLLQRNDGNFSSNLPLAIIDKYNSKIKIIDNSKVYNEVNDTPSLSSSAKITEYYESEHSNKKSFNIELTDENGRDISKKVMGMGSGNSWILSSLANDKSLIKNYLWYNISGKIMSYAPNVRFCEAFEDGKYIGLYLMTEKVTAGDEKIRITNHDGYILSLGNEDKRNNEKIDTFSSYTLRNKKALAIEYPKVTPNNKKDIISDFSLFEKSLYSYDFNNAKYGFSRTTDTDSFSKYFIINEFAGNVRDDYSLYIYKDYSKKLHLAVGDFTNSCNSNKLKKDNFELQNTLWYFMMFKDEKFTKEIISDYQKYSKKYLNSDYINSFIDETNNYIKDAALRNNKIWNISSDDFKTSGESIKAFVKLRTKWMDKTIVTISQYSAESKVKNLLRLQINGGKL